MADLGAVRAAKRELVRSLKNDTRVSGVGIAGQRPDYVLRVNVADAAGPKLPREVRGIPVEVVVTGTITPQTLNS